MSQSDLFSIRQMIELTGISEFTIRGWENRYAAFSPRRSATGRREYKKNDVERALLIRELLKRGHKISKVAHLTQAQLQAIFDDEYGPQAAGKNTVSRMISESLELMALQKWDELADLFKAHQETDVMRLINEFFLPLLSELVKQMSAGVVSIAQEHVLSSFLKEKIYSVLTKLNSNKSLSSRKKIRFVLAAPEGDYHEIGLLLAHLLIRSHGYTSLYLGPHTPAQDLSETALRFEASHLLIVSTVSKKQGARLDPLNFVNQVQKKIGSHSQIWLAGSQAPYIQGDQPTSLAIVTSFEKLNESLLSIRRKM